ncbi:MAG: DUF4214 domain-containing protein [Pseudomonadota bacterium]
MKRFSSLVLVLLLAACGGAADKSATTLGSGQGSRGQSVRVASDYNDVVQQIYVAYFGRPADAGGLAWHAGVLLAAKAPTDIVSLAAAYSTNAALKAEIDSFGASAESAALYPGDNGQFISAVYRNLFSREADAAGKAFWVSVLDAGAITRANAAITLMSGSQGSDISVINNKTKVASNFTSAIVTPVLNAGYDGLAANVVVRAMLGNVGASTDTTAFNATVKTTLNSLAATVAASKGQEVSAAVPAMNSVSAKAVTVLANAVVIPAAGTAVVPAMPANVSVAPANTNLKLWIYDPRTPVSASFVAPGIFLQNITSNGSFNFVSANSDGTLYLQLTASTSYQFDTVEPNGTSSTFQRHRYQVTVSAAGVATIKDATLNSTGFYPVTLDLANVAATPAAQKLQDDLKALASQPASTFQPTSRCQMMDQVTPTRSFNTDLSVGFPKVRVRLPSYGHIRALIVPVDFPDVAGVDNPATFFTPLANDVRDFYLKQSYGRVTFDFDIQPAWVRLPFSTTKYGFGATVNSGDFTSYRQDIINLTEKLIDYSKYDAVYFLVPQQMPFAQMGWGPAITAPTYTSTGYVVNGATGGADMYYNESHGITGGMWKWMAHETGHAFGFVDEDLNHASATLGSWSIMAMNWSNNAIEDNGWDRYLQGWLADSQVACVARTDIAATGTTVALSPLVRQNTDTKVAMVPLSSSKILVMESRKNEGLDHIVAAHEGVLVYTVDMTIGQLAGGYRTQRRAGSTLANFEDAALHLGDSVTVDGIVVTVTASSVDGDTIKLTKP